MACSNDILDVLKAIYPDDVYIVVGVANPLVNGGVAVQPGDQSFTVASFKGMKARLFRNSYRQFNSDTGLNDTWFDYSSISGEFTLSTAVQDQETFICEAYKPA